MSLGTRTCAVLALLFLLVPASFAGDPADEKDAAKKAASTKSATSNSTTTPSAKPATPAPAARATSPSARPLTVPARLALPPSAQGPRGAGGKEPGREYKPIPATTGGLGLFTVETGDLLPRKGFAIVAYGNKFSREPGSITVLNIGWGFSVGLHDRLNLFINWDPHRHIHVSRPGRLSLNAPIANPQYGDTIYRQLVPGSRPGYVEDYPFAFANTGGVGDVTLGVKYALAQESKGQPFSLALRGDFHIPTRTTLSDLLDDGVQSGQFNFGLHGIISKTWGDMVVTTLNVGNRWARDPRFAGQRALQQADQFRVGAGFLLFPQNRLQFMSEYTGIVYMGGHTLNTTFGPRDPIDGVWGVRWYPARNLALDAGYRYMLNLRQHGDRSGFVVKLGTSWLPEKEVPVVNRSPVAACSAEKSSVVAGSNETVRVTARANDPDGDALNYTWTANGGRVDGTGPEVSWNSAGTNPGMYTVTARVDDGKGGTASCAVDIRVEPRPNRAPTLTCSADRSSVLVGERVRITGQGSDADGDSLTYSWRANAGQIVGSGQTVQFDTSGLAPGRYTVTGRVEDGKGGAADCTVGIGVEAPPPPPTASKLNECFFRAGSARVDNVCKRILDDVALRMQNETRARVVMVGYADPREARPDRLARQRGEAAQKYLASKGIAASRVDVRTAGGQAGAGRQNRRIDVIWVPEGATY
jgi:outer membrane protein OmpA-like peptidoglycan-associated protein